MQTFLVIATLFAALLHGWLRIGSSQIAHLDLIKKCAFPCVSLCVECIDRTRRTDEHLLVTLASVLSGVQNPQKVIRSIPRSSPPMIAVASLIHSSAAVTGAVVSARLLTRKPQPIETMVAKLDLAFAAKVAVIASNGSVDAMEWRKLSLWHLHRQAVLMTRIAIELSKLQPDEFANIPAEQKCSLALMRSAAVMCLFEDWHSCTNGSHVNALECARCFLRIFDGTEMLIVRYDPRGSVD